MSGGSFTSAYYALRGTQMFSPADTFNRELLYHNVERDLFAESIYYPATYPSYSAGSDASGATWV